MSEDLPTIARAKIWQPSGLIEEAVVPDQSLLQTEEFDRENPGELARHDLVRRKDAENWTETLTDRAYANGKIYVLQKVRKWIRNLSEEEFLNHIEEMEADLRAELEDLDDKDGDTRSES